MDTVMELEIGPSPEPGSFTVRVLRSASGDEPTGIITLDVDELLAHRPLLEATVLSSAVSARRILPATEVVLRAMGERLFVATFDGAVGAAYRTSRAIASERGTALQIALRLTAPELATLPWESLFDPQAGVYLCRKEPLVRHVPAPHASPALAISPPLRILAMVASPRGLPKLDVEAERERLEEALRPQLLDGLIHLEWLEEASWQGIHSRLLAKKWHVLHFIGHGTFDTESDEGMLAFVGPDGRADLVPANALADLLDEAEPTPRLVVLNSCQSGATGATDLFSGTAAALAHSGIRAVAAMQFSISDSAAIAFARAFYTALAYGRGVDEAVRSGRIGILGLGRGTLEWVTPMLYLRGDDAHLYSITQAPASTEVPTKPEPNPDPEKVVQPTSLPEAEPEPDPEPVVEPRSLPEAEPAPTPDPKPEPAREPKSPLDTEPEAAPIAELEPELKPVLEPKSLPEAEPEPEPTPDPKPEPAREPKAPLDSEPEAASMEEPESESEAGPLPRSEADPEASPNAVAIQALATEARAGALTESAEPESAPSGARRRWVLWIGLGGVLVVAVIAAISLLPRWYGGGNPSIGSLVGVTVPMNGITSSNLSCQAGDRMIIAASGEGWYDASDASRVGPEGLTNGELPELRVLGSANTASLIGWLDTDDDDKDRFAVGSSTSYACPVDGTLYLGINDKEIMDNRGQFEVVVQHVPAQE
ncbi:CHAT domain-containing protein [Agromyces ramosus]|uniref:CHAT domain-containing protein n=1 Tax=Agromyces ramosus TaxID=33879 RepID=A0A4Q7MJY4_9MICO|nr:CHAT domain-containing protein [Agromyces ramosus]RZS68615.1 CHAT domain-containing protein [Agromyces ramosus]